MAYRNIAIIADVDHGKTTLVDELLKVDENFDTRISLEEQAMDSSAQEQEGWLLFLSLSLSTQITKDNLKEN